MNLVWRSEFDAASLVWTLVATISGLVLLWPGLTLFYGGGLESRARSNLFARLPLLLAAMSVAWIFWAYSLAFAPSWGSVATPDPNVVAPMATDLRTMMAQAGPADPKLLEGGGGVVGGTDFVMLNGMVSQASEQKPLVAAHPSAATIPHALFMAFQMTLFVAMPMPLIVILAPRVPTYALVAFALLWGTVVFAPVAHWIWGRGWLHERGVLDSAGGLLHVAVGASALACALGWRNDFGIRAAGTDGSVAESEKADFCTMSGALLFWGGALLLHASLSTQFVASTVMALLNSHLAASAGLLAWTAMDRFVDAHTDRKGPLIGAVVGLVSVAAGCGRMAPQSALTVAVVASVVVCLTFRALRRWEVDRGAMAIVAIQGIGGVIGVLATGLFATSSVAGVDATKGPIHGALEGNLEQIGTQGLAAAAAVALGFLGTLILVLLARFLFRSRFSSAPNAAEAVSVAV